MIQYFSEGEFETYVFFFVYKLKNNRIANKNKNDDEPHVIVYETDMRKKEITVRLMLYKIYMATHEQLGQWGNYIKLQSSVHIYV